MMLATIQAEGERNNANPEAIAVTGISMKMEFDGLVSPSLLLPYISLGKGDSCFNAFPQYTSIKELLALSRKIKELWVFGPLGRGDPNARAKEEQIDRDVGAVASLLDALDARGMQALAQRCGGSWEALGSGDDAASASATVTATAQADGTTAGSVTTGR